MLKRTAIILALVGMFSVASASDANAWVVRRVAPVRRVAARVVLPPYPVARRVVAGPVYRRPIVYGAPVIYATPHVYASPVVYYGY
ncbi:MAG: hypothetical protein KDA57_10885 [Planctomycetales bacterium]|nr:hypothetical protein [Planctomycetales bacterium]